jgi:hypothetical protein
MLGQVHPSTRDELIRLKPGSLEALTPRHVAFQRVRAQFNFERSVLPGETISIQHLSPTGQVGARAVALPLLAVELWNDIGQPLWSSHKISQQINITKNLGPFLRRLAFWQQMGARTRLAPRPASTGLPGASQRLLPRPWRDAPGSGKFPIGPRVFGPLPDDRDADEKKRSVFPAVGGSF